MTKPISKSILKRCSFMILAGIDVAKDKHDCFIMNSDGEILVKAFTFSNNLEGFNFLYEKIRSVTKPKDKIKVGLEATGHYSYNLLGLITKVCPPLLLIHYILIFFVKA